jgi:N-carbamoyl-L-amino-acid hydrolase
MELAKIGATDKGGVRAWRPTWTSRRATCLSPGARGGLQHQRRQDGQHLRAAAGQDDLAAGHDRQPYRTQPSGGKFDGNYGVMAGLEVIRTLNDFNYETNRPIEVIVWTNEEGSRFAPAMIASGVYAGAFDLDYGLSRQDVDGKTIGEELQRIGYAGERECGGREVAAFFEAHIEQGPILEAEGKTIGVVEGVQGIRWYEVTVTGQDAHAGPTPMPRRKDALVGVSTMVLAVNRIGMANQPYACSTVGMMQVSPNSRNVIPGKVFFTVDFRHPDADTLQRMGEELKVECEKICRERKLELDFKEIWYSPPVKFSTIASPVQEGDRGSRLLQPPIVSGASHDSVYMSRVTPTSMIFVPCKDGISHNEIGTPSRTAAAGCDCCCARDRRANAKWITAEAQRRREG